MTVPAVLEAEAEVDGMLVVAAAGAADTLSKEGVWLDGALEDVGAAIRSDAGADTTIEADSQKDAKPYCKLTAEATRQSADISLIARMRKASNDAASLRQRRPLSILVVAI